MECGHVSRAFDPFWDLAVPLPKGGKGSSSDGPATCTLEDCLREFTSSEKLVGENTYYCSRCKAHQPCTKRMELFRLPDVLVLHVKRFGYSSYRRSKLTTSIDMPHKGLDVSAFCSSSAPTRILGDTLYDLVAVSNHSGSLGGGHYTADCRNRDNWDWYDFNDSRVSKSGSLSGSAAYLFFMVRRSVLASLPQN